MPFFGFQISIIRVLYRYLSHLSSIGSVSPDDRSMGKFFSWYLHKEGR